MTDPLSLRQCTFTMALSMLIQRIVNAGYQCKIQELNRTIETQREYVAKGVSKTLDSRHLDNLAADIYIFKHRELVNDLNEYRRFGEYWEGLGGRWGGRFGLEKETKEVQDSKLGWDVFHFEMKRLT